MLYTQLLLMLAFSFSPQEVMFVESFQGFRIIDPQTKQVIRHVALQNSAVDIHGMTHDGARLIVNDRGTTLILPLDETTLVHPADGSSVILGKTGYAWNVGTIEIDPTTGIVYAIQGADLYEIDLSTGAAHWMGPIQGLKPFDCICGLAIDSQGRAVGIGLIGFGLYSLDLPHMSATLLGDLPFNGGFVADAAFDSQGTLYAAWHSSSLLYGIYEIDMATLTVSFFVGSGPAPPSGVAFGPATPETPYCSKKTTSLGCVPVLTAAGIASPTATSGYDVVASGVQNHTNGRLVYSANGAASNPFAGGTWCVNGPWKGSSVVSSGGSPKPVQDCSGSWTVDMNTVLASKPGPQPGDTISCQWIGRDRGFAAPDNYTLSSALQFTLLP